VSYTPISLDDFRAAMGDEYAKMIDWFNTVGYEVNIDELESANDIPVNGVDLRAALDAVLSDSPVSTDQVASIGCSIKWTHGNEPDYF